MIGRMWKRAAGLGAVGWLLSAPVLAAMETSVLTLEHAVARAIAQDPWLEGSRHNESAIRAMSEAAAQLPDPKLNFALANLPTDSFDFNQEAMTQAVIGISQMVPRGDSRELSSRLLREQGEQQPFQRAQRRAQVRLTLSQLWLDRWRAAQSIALIEHNKHLFDQLVDVSTASYISTTGRTRQQDLVRAQLELTQLDDRLTQLSQMQALLQQRMAEWLRPAQPSPTRLPSQSYDPALPALALEAEALIRQGDQLEDSRLAERLTRHPGLQSLDRQIEAAQSALALAQQKYKPGLTWNASYGYRGEDMNGRDRADLVTLGVTVDMPLFSSRAQDSEVEAAAARVEAVRTERLLQLRQMIAGVHAARVQLERLEARELLYRERLLPQAENAAEAALNAYTVDAGDFTEVVRARIAELNARLALLEIQAETQKQIAQLNYFFATSAEQPTS